MLFNPCSLFFRLHLAADLSMRTVALFNVPHLYVPHFYVPHFYVPHLYVPHLYVPHFILVQCHTCMCHTCLVPQLFGATLVWCHTWIVPHLYVPHLYRAFVPHLFGATLVCATLVFSLPDTQLLPSIANLIGKFFRYLR